jgi:hypothetical protein
MSNHQEDSVTAVDESTVGEAQPALVWSVVKREGSNSADVTLGSMYAELSGPELTVVTRTIGKSLIKLGTELLQMRVGSDDDWDDEEGW